MIILSILIQYAYPKNILGKNILKDQISEVLNKLKSLARLAKIYKALVEAYNLVENFDYNVCAYLGISLGSFEDSSIYIKRDRQLNTYQITVTRSLFAKIEDRIVFDGDLPSLRRKIKDLEGPFHEKKKLESEMKDIAYLINGTLSDIAPPQPLPILDF